MDQQLTRQKQILEQKIEFQQETQQQGNVLATPETAEVDYKQKNIDECNAFRERLMEENADAVKEKYRDVFESAKEEQTELKTDINVAGMDKVRTEFLSRQRAAGV